MEALLTSLITLGSLAAGWLLRNFAGNYAKEKGKNLATREDIGTLTDLVERVKIQYAEQLERTKSSLSRELETLKQDVEIVVSAKNRYEDAKSEAYVDLYKAIAGVGIAQRFGSKDKEYEANVALMAAKARIAVYGSKEVAEALGDFFADYSNLCSAPAAASFFKAVQRMRTEAAGSEESVDDAVLSSFSFNRRHFDANESSAVPSPSTPSAENDAFMSVNLTPADLQNLNSILVSAKHDVLENYEELLRNGNTPGMNTMKIAFISYMAVGLSSLDPDQLAALRSNGILRI